MIVLATSVGVAFLISSGFLIGCVYGAKTQQKKSRKSWLELLAVAQEGSNGFN